MALLGSLDTVRHQLAGTAHFAAAYAYLEQALATGSAVQARIRAVPVGETRRVDLGDGAFALEQAYWTRPREEGRFEAHAALVDLQAIVSGEELMEVTDAGRLVERENLIAERDVRFFADFPGASRWRVASGEIAVFFPIDAHMPSLAVAAPQIVYKTVVKVPVPA